MYDSCDLLGEGLLLRLGATLADVALYYRHASSSFLSRCGPLICCPSRSRVSWRLLFSRLIGCSQAYVSRFVVFSVVILLPETVAVEEREKRMAEGERATGTPNTIYDLSSVLFHALEGGTSYDTYIEDSEREGDQELADFFRRVRDEDSMRADEAQRLLAERTPTEATGAPGGTMVEPVEGATMPGEGLAAGAPRREGSAGVTEGRPDMDVAPTEPGVGARRGDLDVPSGTAEAPPPRTSVIEEGALPRTEDASSREGVGRRPEGEREEDKGLLDRAKDALMGEEEERRRGGGTDRPDRR